MVDRRNRGTLCPSDTDVQNRNLQAPPRDLPTSACNIEFHGLVKSFYIHDPDVSIPSQSQPKFSFDVSPVIKNIPALSHSLDLAVPKFFYTLPSFHDAQMKREFALMKKVISDSLSTGRKKEEERKKKITFLRFDKDIRWIFEEFNTVIFRLNYNHNSSSSSSSRPIYYSPINDRFGKFATPSIFVKSSIITVGSLVSTSTYIYI